MPEVPSSEPARFCPQCGADWRASASFCTNCGAPASGAATAVPAPAGRPAAAARSQRRGLWLLLGAVVLIAAAVAVFALLNDSQQQAAGAPVTIPTAPPVAQDIPFPDVARISVENTHVMAMSGEAVIVDVRDAPFFETSHIRGALSLPLSELPARYTELPKDKAILLYCT
jgi:hypothetical protein